MTKNEKLRNIIFKCVEDSFKDGQLAEDKAEAYITVFRRFPADKALTFLKTYLGGIKKYLQDKTLLIETPTALEEAQIKKITELITRKLFVLATQTKIDTSLLGGIRLKIGDIVIDNSVKGRIESLGKNIAG